MRHPAEKRAEHELSRKEHSDTAAKQSIIDAMRGAFEATGVEVTNGDLDAAVALRRRFLHALNGQQALRGGHGECPAKDFSSRRRENIPTRTSHARVQVCRG